MPRTPSRDELEAALGAAFAAEGRDRTCELALSEIVDGGRTGTTEAFSAYFLGPAGETLPQGTYRMAREGAAEFDIFIVPVGVRGDRAEYEAVFNTLMATAEE